MSIVHVAFYPSDWLAGTRGLSAEETGVYITLIARIYEMAGPIERDDNRLARLCGSRSKRAFVTALEHLISEGKIIEVDGFITNERAEKEIKNTTEKSAKARDAAQSRWDKKSNKNKGSTNAGASPEHRPSICQSEPEPDISKTTNVVLCDLPPSHPSPANDLSEAVAAYNRAAEKAGWPQVRKLTPSRAKSLRARLRDAGGLDGWQEALRRAYASDFCREGWRGFGFDSLAAQQKFTRLMEGNYDNRTDRGGMPAERQQDRPDPALEQIARLAGIGQAQGHGGG